MNLSKAIKLVFLFLVLPSAVFATCKDTELYDAVDRSNLEQVAQLISSGSDVNEPSCYGRTPIMATTWWSIPSRENNLEILDLLISKKANLNVQDENGHTALMLATKNQNWQVIRKLIQNKASVNLVDRDGNNTLMTMLSEDVVSINGELFNYILNQNIDLNARNAFGDTALTKLLANEYVIKNDSNALTVMRSLLQKGADQNLMIWGKGDPYKPCTYRSSYNALMLSSCLGNQDIVKTLLLFGPQINAVNSVGDTALVLAAAQNKDDVVALLLQANAQVDVLEAKTSALIKAVQNGNATIVKMLLTAGANIKMPKNQPLLSLCVNNSIGKYENENDYYSVAEMLINHGANLDETDSYNETAIYEATINESLSFMKLLLESGASVNLANKNKEGKAAIHAVRNLEALKLLLQFGANINLKDNASNTLLHYVKDSSELSNNIEWIIKQGAQINAKNNQGYTPARAVLEKAYYAKDFNLAYKFFALGADKDSLDNNGISSLMSLVSNVYTYAKAKDDPTTQFAMWLIKSAVNLNTQSSNGSSILHTAIKIHHDENILLSELLKSKKLDLDIVNKVGDTALLSALNSNVVKDQYQINAAKMVINAGANLNVQNKDGNTALMLELIFGRNADIINLIVNKGANLNLRNNASGTALAIAKQYGSPGEIIKLLIDHGAIE